jgi:MYXO-CTERM domain-containing protein
MRASVIAVVVAGCTASLPAAATYSIVAADTSTREVGGAGTSCLRGGDVYRIYGSVPGVGAVHAQATWNQAGLERAIELLRNGFAPREILDQIAAPEFDPQASTRQYGIVDVTGRVAGFSGEDNRSSAGDRQGEAAGMHYSAQGNILTSEQVLARMAAAFEGAGCDLAERLLLALEAGAEDGEGDSRCTASRGIPSDSAYLQVDRPDEPRGSYLELRVPTSGGANPMLALRENFETWRAGHPCPGVGGSAGAGGSGGSGMAGRAGEAGRGAPVRAETPRAEEGCSCRTSAASDPASGWWIGLLFVALGARRAQKA